MVAPAATKHRHALALRLCMRVEAKGAVKPWVSSPFKWLMGWILFFAVVSWLIYCYFYADAVTTRRESLAGMCDERARMLQDQFTVSVNHVHALAILVSSFHHRKSPSVLDQKTFAEYTAGTAFERPLLSGVAYAQKVVHAEREMFERKHGWTIKTMKREPSPVQDEYAPAIFSQETISYIESLDMMSGEEDRENIERARATGKAVLTSPFRLLESNKLGVILTFPVYGSSLPADATVKQRVQATVGYLGGAFDVESLVENLLWKLAGNEAIVVNVYDITNFFVIGALIGYILYGAIIHIGKVEEDYNKMAELKVQAESADIAKSQFLATVSHEIRTPMNGVLGMLQMLLDTNLDSTQKDYARTAQASGKALITLINEVLDRAKIESGKFELEAVPFDLRSILDDVLSLFSGKSRDKGIEVISSLSIRCFKTSLDAFVCSDTASDKVPEILIGDPGRFRQIITNLVGNSVKIFFLFYQFTERGHIFVQVHLVDHANSLMDCKAGASSRGGPTDLVVSSGNFFNTLSGFEAADERNSWETFKLLVSGPEISSDTLGECLAASGDVTLVVTVEDTGIGIPIHAQDRIFMPFMQADSSTSRTYGGTGIGLSISKCLAELMGGRINFISRPHIGSTFTFTAVLKRYDKDSVKGLKAPLVETVPMGFKGMKAIVVDARPVRAAVTTYHLQRLGMVVEIVNCMNMAIHSASGQNGYTINGLSGKKPDVILVEKESWCHEVENGFFGHLLECKQNGQALEMPKMVLLATSMNHVECAKAKAAGFVDTLIMKPLRASMVAAGLQQVLGIGNIQPQGKGIPNGTPFLHNLLLGKNILVVDDNGINRRVAALALKKYGANVECAVSGKAALTMLQIPHKFDACFMDIQMPEMDGFEVTRQIRQLENKANEQIRNELTLHTGVRKVQWYLPILAMTADLIQATYEECLKCGMDGYVSKPFEKQQLYQAVAKFFEAKPIQDS
ncbi:putative histidine kinase 6 [Nymphaea thermarum]|nr:putative histidine kinase 6 [Nymphaea thermarum]